MKTNQINPKKTMETCMMTKKNLCAKKMKTVKKNQTARSQIWKICQTSSVTMANGTNVKSNQSIWARSNVKPTSACFTVWKVSWLKVMAKHKCEKNKNGIWKFNKEFGMCVECGDDCPEVEMPDMEKPDHEDEEKPMCEEGEDCEEKPEKPMCDQSDETDDCDYEEKPDHDDEKPMCEEGEDCEEKPDGEKPDMEEMPDVFGDDGKWNKCEVEPIDMGKIKCEEG